MNELELLKVRLAAFKTTLQSAAEKTKSSMATITITNDFFELVKQIGEAAPELANHLPKTPKAGEFAALGKSSVYYLDLEIYAEQLLNLLEHVSKKQSV